MDQVHLRDALRLYLVADLSLCPVGLPDVVRCCIQAGVTCVQLRAKHQRREHVVAVARDLRRICSDWSVPLIINDDLEIALAIGADGVHLGVDDVDPEVARGRGGDDFVIGFSPEMDGQIRNAEAQGVSYLGIGPLFATVTKPDAGSALGVGEFKRRVSLSGLPAVAIGGIAWANARLALDAGADGIAVVSSILGADDPCRASAALRSIVDGETKTSSSRT